MIAVRETGGVTVVEVDGEFAERTAEEFNGQISALLGEGKTHVVLNLHRAQWTSLKALKWLVAHVRNFRSRNGDLKLAGLNPYLANLLELTGTLTLFDVHPSVEDAVASFDLVVAQAAK
jgi:anti-sigma B factor antagonist